MLPGMEQLLANISGKTRRDKIGDTEYIVAPLTLIVPGVLDGSQGPLLYEPDEIRKNPTAWNNVPIVLGHPFKDGQYISARDPDVLNKAGIGVVQRAVANGKLIAEGWFDIAATRRVDSRILDSLEAGKPFELSTGLLTDNEPVDGGKEFEGTSYNGIARNFRPDHLAILPDSVGACSVKDGCGVMVNKAELKSALDGMFTDMSLDHLVSKEANMADKKEIVDFLITNCDSWVENDRELLTGLEDDKLTELKAVFDKQRQNYDKLKKNNAVANAGIATFNDSWGNTHTFNEKTGKWESEAAKKEKEPVANEKKEEPPKQKTVEEWLADAPPEIREDLSFARNEKAKQKATIIRELLANVSDDAKPQQIERLQKRSIEELQADLSLMPAKKEEAPLANYFGASVPPAANDAFDDEDLLPLPVTDYSEKTA